MMTMVRSKRITRGGYTEGGVALVAGPSFVREAEISIEPQGPSPEEFELELARRIEIASKEAYSEGFRNGVVEGQQSIEAERALLRGYLEKLDDEIDGVWAAAENHLKSLAMEIGRKVVGEIIDNYSSLALDLARRGVAMAREQTNVSLIVNPEDTDLLRKNAVDLMKTAGGIRHIEVVDRDSVSRGGVIVECDIGQYDLRPEVQLQMLERSLETSSIDNQVVQQNVMSDSR